jgi:hypothetical protein
MKCQNWSKSPATSKGENSRCRLWIGSHSLYLQNERNLEVYSIDISPNAIQKPVNQRGLKNTHVQNILEMDSDNPENKFDTICY